MEKNYLIVTRHPALVEYLEKDLGITGEVVSHATPELVTDRNVIGVLPHSLSCLCETFSEVPLRLTSEMRGKELSYGEVKAIAGEMVTYKVTKI